MKWFILIIVLLVLLGPLRKRFLFPLLVAWRTVVPVTAGFITGAIAAAVLVGAGAPAWLIIFGPVAGALIIGSAGRQWFQDNFPPREK